MTKKEKSELINKSGIIFILNEIQMQMVTQIVDIDLNFKFKLLFQRYWQHTRKLTREVKLLFKKVDHTDALEEIFDVNVEQLTDFILDNIKLRLEEEK